LYNNWPPAWRYQRKTLDDQSLRICRLLAIGK